MVSSTRRPIPHALAAAVGVLTDGMVGEPPTGLHPVRAFGGVMQRFEAATYADTRGAGVAHAVFGAGLGMGAGLGVSTLSATHLAVAGRELRAVATSVGDALLASDLDRARSVLPSLVGRDVERLDAEAMARAVVESVAENTVDAVVAPALWAAVAGAPGALGCRAVNTLDSMVGHKDARYLLYGWASARLDDVVAFVPARLTAALVVAVRPRAAADVWRAVRTQAPAHPSPNAGVAEAAFAAALDVRLGGETRYGGHVEQRPVLGTGAAPVSSDIARAVRLSRDVCTALAVALGVTGALRAGRRKARRSVGRIEESEIQELVA